VLPSSSDTQLSHRYLLTNNAAEVAEGVGKAESALVVTTATLTPKKVAHFIPTTAEAVSDHPRMRALIDSELTDGVISAVESLIATDLAAWTGLATQAYSNSVVETILKAKTAANEYTAADGILMANSDYEALALTAGTANDHYIAPGPFGPAMFTLWGLPVYPTSSVAAGFAYVGRMASLVWNEVWPIRTATGWTGTQFTENEITVLCETRGMLDVTNNLHIVKADLTA
jgi:HK97 family phage major capsid protein